MKYLIKIKVNNSSIKYKIRIAIQIIKKIKNKKAIC